jgi:predicted nicotinamide N-methyase
MDVGDVEARFGLKVRTHAVGAIRMRIAEVERVDEMVEAVYPDAVAEHGDAPVWMLTWPAALGLAEHVVRGGVEDVRVLELGCGTAAPGIAAALAGADVVLTDYDPVALAVARHNVGLNGCEGFEVRTLDWFRPDLAGRFDLVIGSEVVYFEKHFPALLAVLALYVAPGGRVLLSDQGRPQVADFQRLCHRAGFEVSQVVDTVHLEEESRKFRVTTLRPGP